MAPKKHDLTSLQLDVLMIIAGSRLFGREIREKLASQGREKSLAAFYELMGRLEDAGLVEGEFVERPGRPGQRERRYRVTADGIAAVNELGRRVVAAASALKKARLA